MTEVGVHREGPEAGARVPATMAEILLARRGDHRPGLLHEDAAWSWDEVVGEAAVRAAAAGELRPQEGPFHIGVLLDNVPEYLFWLGGAALAQATVVGINPTRRGAELAADLACTDVGVVVTDDAGAEMLRECGTAVPVVSVESPEYAALLARHAGAEPPAGPF
ncbi:MAG: acyl-CoA synthetase, partial [Streptomycetaceae bacterium]|nr:acyl-CoA synthetase [Streptomycetaceae bacterium]